jgi:hypothetical protein
MQIYDLSNSKRMSKLAIALLVSLFWPTEGDATLYVVVLDRDGIAIASDSRHITLEGGKFKTLDGVEKVVSLGANMAFVSFRPDRNILCDFRNSTISPRPDVLRGPA